MSGVMRQIPFSVMLNWMADEYTSERSIFGIPEASFQFPDGNHGCRVFDEYCSIPVGPAAGPHTQLAQNIVAAYLAGGRFIELKTVQKLDRLEIEKPCIDVRDEGYNTEWSTELLLEEAYDEYVKAWVLLHFLESFKATYDKKPSFIFNMSVGYDLEGIQTEKMDGFITGLSDAENHPVFLKHLEALGEFVENGGYERFAGLKRGDAEQALLDISPRVVRSVTLSTMHGCPPDEIEKIATYLMEEKKLDVFVKLNPTLLGYDTARRFLDVLGFTDVELKETSFTHDLQYEDAVAMLGRLDEFADAHDRGFGIKLSNTLPVVNRGEVLPGDEMYMSGRSLFPLTINLAARLSEEFSGLLPISYSGGASQLNIQHIYQTGIRPITTATELLKPGGYLRLKEMARALEQCEPASSDGIDVASLRALAEDALHGSLYKKAWRGAGRVSVDRNLPVFDCYIAPCTVACPIHQDVPAYIQAAGTGDFSEALRIIYEKNPLPRITGYICDHQCMECCTRLDYEGPVLVREVKRIAAENGSFVPASEGFGTVHAGGGKTKKAVSGESLKRIAVIGAGPSGLSAAYFLARLGFSVTVFEKEEEAGGVTAHVLPSFRIPRTALDKDIADIKELGVEFQFGVKKLSIDGLHRAGFQYIFIGIGAEKSKRLRIPGAQKHIFEALDFLRSFNTDPSLLHLGRRIAVIGGGNTAMDSARAARTISGVTDVYIIYRRTEAEMPADREEFDNALADGVLFKPLLQPELLSRGILTCRKMALGGPDESGRRRPVPTDDVEKIPVDTVISAIGEYTDPEMLRQIGLHPVPDATLLVNEKTGETEIHNVFIGGDAYRGPSTVVESIADARRAALAIARREIPGLRVEDVQMSDHAERKKAVSERKGMLILSDIDYQGGGDAERARTEALRCLECSTVCNKCIDVCPNRANVAISVKTKPGFRDIMQVLHLDPLCNECGNCGSFCPYDGLPYRDKFTLFATKEDFDQSSNSGFVRMRDGNGESVLLRLGGNTMTLEIGEEGGIVFSDVWKGKHYPEWEKGTRITEAVSFMQTVLSEYRYIIDGFSE